ncbi:MASE3 domain-containing protein [Methanofollis fontis]|nr:MASE3 domain-containing protein [Methanofollis fontis]
MRMPLPPGKEVSLNLFVLFLFICSLGAIQFFNPAAAHFLGEMIAVVISGVIFVTAWNVRRFQKNDFLVSLGIGFLFVSVLRMAHSISVLPEPLVSSAFMLNAGFGWAAVGVEAATFLIALSMTGKKGAEWQIFGMLMALSGVMLLIPFVSPPAPMLIPLAGVVVACAFALSGYLFWKRRDEFDAWVLGYLIAAIFLLLLSGVSVMIFPVLSASAGTVLEIGAFAFVYCAIIETGLQRPYALIFRNLSRAEAEARDERDRAQNYLDIAAVIILVLDLQGRVLLINCEGERLIGCTQEEVIGTDWVASYVPEADRAGVRSMIASIDTGISDALVHENEIVGADGAVRRILWRNAVLENENGRTVGVLASGADVTEEYLAKEALAQANRKLALLTSITRHDILNRLMALDGYLDLAENMGVSSPYVEKAHLMASGIEQDLRFTSEYQQMGNTPPVWQEPGALIRSCAALNGVNALVNADLNGVRVYADPMLEKVFCNLITNALNHGGEVSAIRFSSVVRDGTLVIRCEDDGVGVPPDEKEAIFRAGFGKNQGYGLFLIREILGITDITITETGRAGFGACFEIAVPPGRFRM